MAEDIHRYFRIEARELLDGLAQGALDLEKGTPASDLVPRMLRLAHTLKGAARVVRQHETADLAHAVEDALAVMRDSIRPISRDQIDRMLGLLDDIRSRVGALAPPSASRAPDASPDELFRAFRPDIQEMDVLLHHVAESHGLVASLRQRLSGIERARHLVDLLHDQLAAQRRGAVHDKEAKNGKLGSIAEELRSLVGAVGGDLTHSVERIDRALQDVRDAAEGLRLVPASSLFTLLERTARDAAQTLGKRVVFAGTGADVRLDAAVLGVMQGALLQLVRNAVAHGIESPAHRRAAGKPVEGRVSVEVRRHGQTVTFRCADDGCGVDLDAVRRTVDERGLRSAGASTSNPEALLRLLFKGGISTSRTVTDAAGRGVGLDVVREAAEQLNGEVAARTIAGQGTTIEITVPVVLASFQGLVVEVSGVTAIIPLDAVRGCVRVAREQIVETAGRRSILHDGTSMTLASLARALEARVTPAFVAGTSAAVIVQGGVSAAAFTVDRIVGAANVVLRPLPEHASAARLVAGVSPDAEDNLRLVLDPEALVAAADDAGFEERPESRRTILVVDDSLTTQMLEQSILESAGYEVGLASSGEEALVKARSNRYALFLVDIEMPGMDGFAFIERTKADPALRDIPSILVTSRSSAEDRQRGQHVGAHGYIVKSEFDQGVLLDRIRSLVS